MGTGAFVVAPAVAAGLVAGRVHERRRGQVAASASPPSFRVAAGRAVKPASRGVDGARVDRRRTLLVIAALLTAGSFALRGPGGPGVAPAAGPARGISPLLPVVPAAAAGRRQATERQAEARRLRRSRSVRGALRRAWLAGAISRARYEQLRHVWWRAQRDAGRLTGTRRAELQSVLATAQRLAAARLLTASRLEPVFLTVRRNREFWTARPLPQPNARMTFAGDPVVFQYYAGRGLAIQPLASFGTANALAGACLRADARYRCRPAALRRLLDRMIALGSRRGGFLAWEYLFSFGGGTPPWISAMTQATGAQALVRGARALATRQVRYMRAARGALGAFEAAPPTGVALRSGSGARYAMYSFDPGLRILNGELQALIGLRDVARIAHSARARGLYERGERVARGLVRAFDTGAWSLYSAGGEESTLSYHRLLAGFLQGLCRRTGTPVYCSTGRRFAGYVHEPPRLQLRVARRLRVRERTAVRFMLSKFSDVTIEIRDRRGRVAFARTLRLEHGRHRIVWRPARAGRQRLRIVARGPAGTRGVLRRTLVVKAAPTTAKARSRAKAHAR